MELEQKTKASLKNLIEFAESNGLRYECYSPAFDRWGDTAKLQGSFFFGVQLEDGIYFWFKGFNNVENPHMTEMFWDHRYNANSGYMSKGFGHYFKALDYFRGGRKIKKSIKRY